MERERERDRYKGKREQWKELMRKGTIGRERETRGKKRERHTLDTLDTRDTTSADTLDTRDTTSALQGKIQGKLCELS